MPTQTTRTPEERLDLIENALFPKPDADADAFLFGIGEQGDCHREICEPDLDDQIANTVADGVLQALQSLTVISKTGLPEQAVAASAALLSYDLANSALAPEGD